MCEKCRYSRGPTLAERLWATSRDRRLEAAICNGLNDPPSADSDLGGEEDAGIPPDERELTERGRRIARFLVNEYAETTLVQREFFVQLAAEIVQRIAEDLPGAAEVPTPCAPLNRPEAKSVRPFRMALGLFSRLFRGNVNPRG